MSTQSLLLAATILVTYLPALTNAHGRMLNPPSRMSAYLAGYDTPVNYQDHEMNCGGRVVQWDQNQGKCGICGDPWSGPRLYERPDGRLVQHDIIPTTYTENAVITVRLQITVNHNGWHEFRICDIAKSGGIEASQECLDQTLLTDENGESRFYLPKGQKGFFDFILVLPEGLTCQHCLMQWKWHCGNDWGCDLNACGVGLGARQEEFYACSDVTVLSRDGNGTPGTTRRTPSNITASATATTATIATTTTTTTTTTVRPIRTTRPPVVVSTIRNQMTTATTTIKPPPPPTTTMTRRPLTTTAATTTTSTPPPTTTAAAATTKAPVPVATKGPVYETFLQYLINRQPNIINNNNNNNNNNITKGSGSMITGISNTRINYNINNNNDNLRSNQELLNTILGTASANNNTTTTTTNNNNNDNNIPSIKFPERQPQGDITQDAKDRLCASCQFSCRFNECYTQCPEVCSLFQTRIG